MFKNKLQVDIVDDSKIRVINISKYLLENCLVQCTDLSNKIILFERFSINSGESFIFDTSSTLDQLVYVKAYTNEKLILEKKLNYECVVLLTTKENEKLSNGFIQRLREKSDIDIINYTLFYDSDLILSRNIRLDISEKFKIPKVCHESTKLNYQRFIFMDCGLLIDNLSLLDKLGDCYQTPIFNSIDDYEIGPQLTKFMNLNTEISNIDTSVIIFNKTHSSLFFEINNLNLVANIDRISKFEDITENFIFSAFFNSLNINVQKCNFVQISNDVLSMKDFYLSNKNSDFAKTDISLFRVKEQFRTNFEKIVYGSKTFESELLSFFENIQHIERRRKVSTKITNHFVNGVFLEINTENSRNFEVLMYDGQDKLFHSANITGNMWTRSNRRYYDDYTTVVKESGKIIYQNKIDLKGKRVYIPLESSSLGDSLAWVPYAEEFRKKHNCHVIVSTFKNELFKDNYPELEFIKPGEMVHNLAAMFCIGWYYNENGEPDKDKCPSDFRNEPLQKTASDILGLEFKEIRPRLSIPKVEKKKKVGIGIHGTAQSKYWNNEKGWQDVVDFLIELGYEVVLYSKENDGYMGNNHPKGITKFPEGDLQTLINDLATCQFFIGIGSGLSWLAWSTNLPIVLVSGFSHENTETTLDTWRVINKKVCYGCFNTHRLDASDWNWCPVHKGTDRQFECSKTITSHMVIDNIKDLIKTKGL